MMADFRPMIAGKLRDKTMWVRSFQLAKAHLNRMVADEEAELVRPQGGAARNMVRLTEKGKARWLKANPHAD